jgi:hypothetical protein
MQRGFRLTCGGAVDELPPDYKKLARFAIPLDASKP